MSQYAKFLTALFTLLLAAIAQGLIPEPWATWISLAIGALGVAGVWAVPNAPKPLDGGIRVTGDAVIPRTTLTAAEGEANVHAAFPDEHYTTGRDE